jgi:hypothetical protein
VRGESGELASEAKKRGKEGYCFFSSYTDRIVKSDEINDLWADSCDVMPPVIGLVAACVRKPATRTAFAGWPSTERALRASSLSDPGGCSPTNGSCSCGTCSGIPAGVHSNSGTHRAGDGIPCTEDSGGCP